jgi:hypothetical protein
VIAIKQHKQSADSRWQHKKALFSEGIGVEKSSAVIHTKIALSGFIIAVQRCEVGIRRRLIDIYFTRLVGCAEKTFRDVSK